MSIKQTYLNALLETFSYLKKERVTVPISNVFFYLLSVAVKSRVQPSFAVYRVVDG